MAPTTFHLGLNDKIFPRQKQQTYKCQKAGDVFSDGFCVMIMKLWWFFQWEIQRDQRPSTSVLRIFIVKVNVRVSEIFQSSRRAGDTASPPAAQTPTEYLSQHYYKRRQPGHKHRNTDSLQSTSSVSVIQSELSGINNKMSLILTSRHWSSEIVKNSLHSASETCYLLLLGFSKVFTVSVETVGGWRPVEADGGGQMTLND